MNLQPVTLVLGGQFGSEGKGAFIAWLLDPIRHPDPVLAIRTGGPNAGHSMLFKGKTFKMQHVPCAWANPKATMALGPGAVIDLNHLLDAEIPLVEMATGAPLVGRFFIDPMAAIIRPEDVAAEQGMVASIGSTAHGVGAATAARVMRTGQLARDIPALAPYLRPVSPLASDAFRRGEHVLVETTQGWGLSLTRSGFYPFATSRDITPAQALNDAGIPSQVPHDVIMVCRTYPIRVAGNSGPMHKEITWEDLSRKTGGYVQPERTTVTNKIRRIGEWDSELVTEACKHVVPAAIALTFFDYVRPDLAGQSVLDADAFRLIRQYEKDLTTSIQWVSTGFQNVVPLFSSPESSLN